MSGKALPPLLVQATNAEGNLWFPMWLIPHAGKLKWREINVLLALVHNSAGSAASLSMAELSAGLLQTIPDLRRAVKRLLARQLIEAAGELVRLAPEFVGDPPRVQEDQS
jgi:hypothetical protein